MGWLQSSNGPAGGPRRGRRVAALGAAGLILVLGVLGDGGPALGPAWADGRSAGPAAEPMFEPCFRSGAPSDVLVSGPPTLARGHLHAFVDLLETAFDLCVPQAVEQELRDAFETEYEELGKGEREVLIELVARMPHIKDAARAGDRETVTQGLNAFRSALDGRLRRAPARASSLLLERVLARRTATAWPGDPAVHGSAADAWMEVAQFLLRLAVNEVEGPTPGQIEAMTERLGEELRARPHAERVYLKDAHRMWLRVKSAWDSADSATRTRMRWAAVRLLNDLLPEARRLVLADGRDLPGYAAEARRLRQGLDRFDAFGLLARNPDLIRPVLETEFGIQGAGSAYIFLFRTGN